MKKKAAFGIVFLLSLGLIACGKEVKSISESKDIKIESSSQKEERKEESNNIKIKEHKEDWHYLLGNMLGEVDWNANMPNVGEWAFYNNRYYPNKRVGDTPDPYFFMVETVFTNHIGGLYGFEIKENVEEVPEVVMGVEKIWTDMGSSTSTLGAKSEQSTRAVIKTQKKVTLDGYDFMRVTGAFEVYNDESKEVEKTFKYIAYFYTTIDPKREEDDRFEASSLLNNMIYWSEGFSEERGDYNSIEETADKIMSTFRLSDEQRAYWNKKKAQS